MHRKIALIAVLVVAIGCGDDGPSSPTPVPPAPVTPPVTMPTPEPAVTLDTLSLRGPGWFVDDPVLEVDETVQLNVYAIYSDETEEKVTDDADWRSSNDHVATIVGGLVTGRHAGGAEVQVSYEELEVRSAFRVEPAPEPEPDPDHPPVQRFRNCTAMRGAGWYDGVRRSGGTYRESWNDAEKRTYGLNTHSDRDNDGHACERS
jgi:hypothetical protein